MEPHKPTTRRDRARQRGATFHETPHKCTRCGGLIRALRTRDMKRLIGLECSDCDWMQYPDILPPISSTPEADAERARHEKNAAKCPSRDASDNTSS